MTLLSKVTNLPLRYKDASFDSFTVSGENSKQFNFCKSWDGKSSLFLTGNTGTGKTHLGISLLKAFPKMKLSANKADKEKRKYETYERCEPDPEVKKDIQKAIENGLWGYRQAICLFVPMVEMFIELNEAAQDTGKKIVLDKYTNSYDCICFDDFGAEKLTDAKRENFYYIIDKRYRDLRTTIVTSNFTIDEINQVEPRIASRFAEMGTILKFNGSDYRKKPLSG